MAAGSTALAFGAMLGGAIVIEYGVRTFKSAGSSSTPTTTAPTTSASPPTTTGQVTSADLQSVAAEHDWDSTQIGFWQQVITKESGGNPKALNPKSGAAGIAQFIDGWGEYAKYGGSADSVTGQLTAMANYIKQRYVTPEAAWQH